MLKTKQAELLAQFAVSSPFHIGNTVVSCLNIKAFPRGRLAPLSAPVKTALIPFLIRVYGRHTTAKLQHRKGLLAKN